MLPFTEKVRAQNGSDQPTRLDQPSLPHSFLQIVCPTKISSALVLQKLVIVGNGLTQLRHFRSGCQIYSFTSRLKVSYVRVVAQVFKPLWRSVCVRTWCRTESFLPSRGVKPTNWEPLDRVRPSAETEKGPSQVWAAQLDRKFLG